MFTFYEGHLQSSYHGIITPQCFDKMPSNSTFLETRIQRLLDGLFFVEKGLGVHVQGMVIMSRGSYTGGNFKQNTWKKAKENWGPYFTGAQIRHNDLWIFAYRLSQNKSDNRRRQ